jgi:3-hydroxybutyryl-CoA dehydratase
MRVNHAQITGSDWPRVGDQLPKQCYGPLDGDALRRYANASGDNNPLHLDLAIAQRAGLEERPIHGMIMMGHFEPMIFAWRPDLALVNLSAKFLRPVLAGQTFEISGRVIRVTGGDSPSIILRLMAHGGAARDLALVAEAKLLPDCSSPA